MDEKLPDHISMSQVMTWLRCPRQWYYRYLRGLKEPPPGALVLGGAVHKALEHQNMHKAVSFVDARWDVVADVYSTQFDLLAPDALWDEPPGKAKDRGYAALRRYHTEVAPAVQPASPEFVERKLTLPIAPGIVLHGVADVITADGELIDYKTVSKSVQDVSPEVKLQLWIYREAVGHVAREFQLSGLAAHYLIARDPPPEPKIVRVGDPDPIELGWWMRAMEQIRRAMERAVETQEFLPANPAQWVCTPKWCGYYDRCRQDF